MSLQDQDSLKLLFELYEEHPVGKWFTQKYGVDNKETFTSVAHLPSIHILIVVAASRHRHFSKWKSKMFSSTVIKWRSLMQPPLGLSHPPPQCMMSSSSFIIWTRAGTLGIVCQIQLHSLSPWAHWKFLWFLSFNMIITRDNLDGIQEVKQFLN